MKNKHLFQILLLTVIFMALVVISVTSTKKNFPQKPITTTPETPPSQNRPAISLDGILDNEQIDIIITPRQNSVILSAFALRAFIKTSPPFLLQTNNLKSNNQLIKDGWSFPFEKLFTDSSGVITVELSAFHIGKSPYPVDKDIVIASITIPYKDGVQIESFSIDNNVTQFLSSDAVSEVEVITKVPHQQ